MKFIKFNLSGEGAIFKRPHINSVNLTYGNIHKVALMGLLGAVLGFKGHSCVQENSIYPEFYEKLNGIEIAIVPKNNGFFKKHIRKFTNTTCFYNKGNNEIIEEQILIKPEWDIFIGKGNIDDEIYSKLEKYLLNNQSEYQLYLGKNHYHANINNVEVVDLVRSEEVYVINSLFKMNDFTFEGILDTEEDDIFMNGILPYQLTPNLNHYNEDMFCYTNRGITPKHNVSNRIYEYKDLTLYFF